MLPRSRGSRVAGSLPTPADRFGTAIASIQAQRTMVAGRSLRSEASTASGRSHIAYQGTSQADATSSARVAHPAVVIGSAPRHARTRSHPATAANATA